MIHTAKQLKDKVKNMSGGNSEVAQEHILKSLEHLDLMQLTIFLRRMHGILEMHLLGPIITI